MSGFPDAIDAYGHDSFLTGDLLFSSETLTVTVNRDLAADRRLMLGHAGRVNVASAALAKAAGLAVHGTWDVSRPRPSTPSR